MRCLNSEGDTDPGDTEMQAWLWTRSAEDAEMQERSLKGLPLGGLHIASGRGNVQMRVKAIALHCEGRQELFLLLELL